MKESEKMVQIDKTGTVTKNGKVIGKIEIDGGVFIGQNFLTSKRVQSGDFDEVFAWLGGQNS